MDREVPSVSQSGIMPRSRSVLLYVHRESTRIIKDKEPRTDTSTFTQLLSSEDSTVTSVLLYVHRDH